MRLFVSTEDMPKTCTACPFGGEGDGCILRDRLTPGLTSAGVCPLETLPSSSNVSRFRWSDLTRGYWCAHTPIAMVGITMRNLPLYKRRCFNTVGDLFESSCARNLGSASLLHFQSGLSLPPLEMVSVDAALALVYRSVPATRYEEVKDQVLRLPAFAPSHFVSGVGVSSEPAIVLGVFRTVMERLNVVLDDERFRKGLTALPTWQLGIPVYLRALSGWVLPKYVGLDLEVGDTIWLNGYTRDGCMKCRVYEKSSVGGSVSYAVTSNVGYHIVHTWDFGKVAFLSHEEALLGMEQCLHSLYPRINELAECFVRDTSVGPSVLKTLLNVGIERVDDLSRWCASRLKQESGITDPVIDLLTLGWVNLDRQFCGEDAVLKRVYERYIK